MNVEVFLTSVNLTEEDVAGRTVVVIDVLRASGTIITALHQGARDVVPGVLPPACWLELRRSSSPEPSRISISKRARHRVRSLYGMKMSWMRAAHALMSSTVCGKAPRMSLIASPNS